MKKQCFILLCLLIFLVLPVVATEPYHTSRVFDYIPLHKDYIINHNWTNERYMANATESKNAYICGLSGKLVDLVALTDYNCAGIIAMNGAIYTDFNTQWDTINTSVNHYPYFGWANITATPKRVEVLWLVVDNESATAPYPDFIGTPLTGNAPLTVAFNDTSLYTPISWLWNFGDNSTSTEQNPLHLYSQVGTYTVSLNVTNMFGSSTLTRSNYISVTGSYVIYPFYVNVQDAISGFDITSSIDIGMKYNNTWYNDTPPYPSQFDYNYHSGQNNFTMQYNNPFANDKNTLSFLYNPTLIVGTEALRVSKTGYYTLDLPLTSNLIASVRYVKLIPLSAYTTNEYNFTKAINVYDAGGNTDLTIVDVVISGQGLTELINPSLDTGLASFINNPCGYYTGNVYINETRELAYSWSFSNACNALHKPVNGTLYTKEIYLGSLNNMTLPELPNQDVYVFGKDAVLNYDILPYDVMIRSYTTNQWYNYTVWLNLGDWTTHQSLPAGYDYDIYVHASGYLTAYKKIFLMVTGNHKTYIDMPLYKGITPPAYIIWNINVYDASNNYPIPNATVSIWEALSLTLQGLTSNSGKYSINMTNTSGTHSYDVVVIKTGYVGQTKADVVPIATDIGIFETNVYLSPVAVVPTITPVPSMTGMVTPYTTNPVLSYANKRTCRLVLDWNNETFYSPITNIEACIGIEDEVKQNYILATLIIGVCGMLVSRRIKTLEGFLVGAIAGNTISLMSGLIQWQIWVLIIIPFALVYFIKKEKIKV